MLRGQVRRLLQIPLGRRPPPVLLLGETGTGKGLLARLLHRAGPRADGPFVDVNCAAIPEALLEAELFGFTRGAFTDAHRAKSGLFQAAHRGTLFLDEIALLPHALQAKLLTAIESRQVRPLGSTRNEPVDVWILAATSEDLPAAMEAGTFRRELYHRIATLVLQLPPLRARGADILALANHFLARAAADHEVPPKVLGDDASAALRAHPWPGNIRELANVLERVTLLGEGPVITAAMLALPAAQSLAAGRPRTAALSLDAFRADEREELISALVQARGNISRAAARLGVPRNTLRYRMARHGLNLKAASAGDSSPKPELSPRPPIEPPRGDTVAAVIRWEQRLLTLLAGKLEPPDGAGYASLASALQGLVEKAMIFGGRVEELTPSGLIAVFGIDPMEDAPRRAVHAANAMIRALEQVGSPGTPPVIGRFAIHVGRYLTASGSPVVGMDATARNEAGKILSGLLKEAGPNGIVVDAAAAPLVERRFPLEPTVASTVAPVYRVVGRERLGFDVRGRTLSRFVGRDRDLAMLQELLRRVEGGEGQCVSLVGEPGVGKSRLVHEFRRTLEPGRVTCLEGRCLSYGSAIAYLPIMELVRAYFGVADSDPTPSVADRLRVGLEHLGLDPKNTTAYFLHLLGSKEGAETLQTYSPEMVKARTLENLKHVLRSASHRRPLLVVVEDLHWIDPSSEEVLGSLAESVVGGRLMLLVTYRPGYLPAWLARSYASQLVVPRLDRGDSMTVVRSVGPTLPPDLVEVIVRHGEGVPLYLEELARAASDDPDVRTASQVPDTIHGVIRTRLERLPRQERQVLGAAAVIGRDVPLPILEAVAELPPELVRESLGRLQNAEFVYQRSVLPAAEYTFRHALIHDVTYESLSEEQRQARHSLTAGAIETLDPDTCERRPEVLAQHYTLAGERQPAIEWWHRAGRRALDRGTYAEALTHIRKGLELLEPLQGTPEGMREELKLQLALGMGLMTTRGYGAPETERAFARARELCVTIRDSSELFPVLFGLWRFHILRDERETTLELAMQLLTVAEDRQDPGLLMGAHGALGQTLLQRGKLAEAREHLEHGAALIEPETFESTLTIYGQDPGAATLSLLGLTLALQGYSDRAMEAGDRALAQARRVRHPFSLAFALDVVAIACLVARDAERAGRYGEEELAISQEHGFPYYAAAGLWFTGYALFMRGEPDRGVALMSEAAPTIEVRPDMHCVISELLIESGRIDDALRTIEGALVGSNHRDWLYGAELLRVQGEALLRQSDPNASQAEQCFLQAMELARRQGARALELRAATSLAQLWAQQGKRAAARDALAQVYGWFTEGLDGRDQRAARDVLESFS